jgi:chaperone required for assembly of F1-ATPase
MLTRAKPEPLERPRRFYKLVDAVADGPGFVVRLDLRNIRTPQGALMCLPTLALAELIAAEWAAQDELIVLSDMPATRLAHTAIDAVDEAREATAAEVARYAGSDLLCYFADGPKALVDQELTHWGPVLDWAERDLGLTLERATGIVHRAQPHETLDRVKVLALALDSFVLAGLAQAAGLFGSAILALAVERGELTGETAFDLSRLDEAFQEGQWGVDEEAALRTARMRAEAAALTAWFEALKARPAI